MVNRAAGEIYKTSSILAQTFGETVATAFGLVFYQKSDGKLYRRGQTRRQPSPANSSSVWMPQPSSTRWATSLHRGESKRRAGRWTIGGLVYVSPTSPGGLTQTVPTGTQKVRPVGFATKSDQIDFRPTQPEVRVARTATYVVAASDAPAHVKKQADYVCDGTDDQVEIQAAIDALPTGGGIVHLTTGNYTLDVAGTFYVGHSSYSLKIEGDGGT
jgi:hypothetical protein